MSVFDSIDDLETATLTIQRSQGAYNNDGVYAAGTPSTFTVVANVQIAFNINRIVGGADLHAHVDDQSVTTVYQFWTRTEIRTRTPSNDPDLVIGFLGVNWTVARVDILFDPETGELAYHAIISKLTSGAS